MKFLHEFANINGYRGVSLNKRKHILSFDGNYHSNHIQFQRWLESDDDVESEYFDTSYPTPVPFRPVNKT